MHDRDRGDAQGVTLAAPHDHSLVERGPLGGLQVGGAEEAGDLAGQVEGDRRLRGRGVLLGGGVAADRTDSVRTAYLEGSSIATPGRGGDVRPCCLWPRRPAVRQFPLEVALEFAGGGEGLHH
ncbi:hypothetical protein GCM10018980_74380 [Streptomyces capoamus]|uniref:Uncharacterized protein n=1 Tax=Streptomyces capoamus TaxID=68183 RepID=A0A919KFR9_9ACTN|nr:hypothetical protein GCM10010501_75480 [Streptomyces libani subsp. rufus]GHG76440.1 hypothetical protein GCM10018980_74380 [Streptomyces capoamus]